MDFSISPFNEHPRDLECVRADRRPAGAPGQASILVASQITPPNLKVAQNACPSYNGPPTSGRFR